jgi:homogentisate 1,2-dioxygenase
LDFGESPLWPEGAALPLLFHSNRLSGQGDILTGRQRILANQDTALHIASFDCHDRTLYRNASADEILFVHHGSGCLDTEYGTLSFQSGDYLVLPKSCIYGFIQLSGQNRFLIIESFSPLRFPSRYRNESGQFLEHSPFCERDIRPPSWREYQTEGPVTLLHKARGSVQKLTLAHHPFLVSGWDGFHFPFALSVHDFEPIVGRIHQPPPVHQVFQSDGFVVCNFVPRLFDFHPEAVPAPYFHQNIDSDEILYYVEGDFMSRTGIEDGSVTLHPAELPHGPQPGKIEASIGAKEVYEIAVMVDTFRPIVPTQAAQSVHVPTYPQSWRMPHEP